MKSDTAQNDLTPLPDATDPCPHNYTTILQIQPDGIRDSPVSYCMEIISNQTQPTVSYRMEIRWNHTVHGKLLHGNQMESHSPWQVIAWKSDGIRHSPQWVIAWKSYGIRHSPRQVIAWKSDRIRHSPQWVIAWKSDRIRQPTVSYFMEIRWNQTAHNELLHGNWIESDTAHSELLHGNQMESHTAHSELS